MSKTAIKLTKVRKVYLAGELHVEALRGVSLSIHEGEYVAIIGPSGSGKSTLMNILGCLDTLTTGSYFLRGEDISRLNDDSLSATRNQAIGFVFQNYSLLPRLTALENVRLPQRYSGTPVAGQAEAMLEKVGLNGRTHHLPAQLSGGQQQRVAIARALVNDPEILLADEPTGNLDSKSSREVLDLFKDLNREGRTVVLVTHDREVAREANRVIEVRDGLVSEDRKRRR